MQAAATTKQATRTRSLHVALLTLALTAIAGALLVGASDRHQSAATTLPWPLLAVASAVAGSAMFYLEDRKHTLSFSLGAVPLLTGLVFLPPGQLLLAEVAGALLWATWVRQNPLKAAFNVGQVAACCGVALFFYVTVLGTASPIDPRGWLALATAAVASELVATLAISAGMSLHSGARSHVPVREVLVAVGAALINGAVALLAVLVLWVDLRAVWLLVALAAALAAAYHAHASLRRRYASLDALFGSSRRLAAQSAPDTVVTVLLDEAAALLRARRALLVLEGPDGPQRHELVRDEHPANVASAHRLPPGDDELERAVLAAARPVLARRRERDAALRELLAGRGWRDLASVPVDLDGERRGAVIVADRVSDVSTFDSEDLRVLEAFIHHGASALRKAELHVQLRAEAAASEHRALHDELTGLGNRAMFSSRTNEHLRDGGPVGVLLLDLDRFKEVNDGLGHGTGDHLLRELATRLRHEVATRGWCVRLGGDEFAVVLPHLGDDPAGEALDVARAVRRRLQAIHVVDDLALEPAVSVGVAVAPEHGTTTSELLRHADIAMYLAKSGQTGVELYRPDLDTSSQRRLALVSELRQALDEEHPSLWLAYQPKADLASGRIVGVEALARWTHARHGPLPPDEFIPLAEQSGLIHALTRWALRTAIADLATWRAGGADLSVAVNLSARSLRDEALADDLTRWCEEAGVPCPSLTLELTEGTVIGEHERTGPVLDRLAALGVRLSVDDFGTGYSSLAYLKRLPVDEVKIDRVFVRDLVRDDQDAAIVASTLDLARHLGLTVVAEGVEDEASWHRLRAMGCGQVQGWFVARPMRGTDLPGFLASWTAPAPAPAVRSS